MTQQKDWASQLKNELEKQTSARAAQVESLLFSGDFDAIRTWLDQWESDDKAPDSLRQRYRSVRSQWRKERYRQRQQQLYGSLIDRMKGKASTKSLTGSGASSIQTTEVNKS
ncbi:MAG TPA: hypothetical protein V6D11_11355 [Waterburya sp.]|jgi:hypothetical protein